MTAPIAPLTESALGTVRAVLDTNAALDLWGFQDKGVAPLRHAIGQRQLVVLACRSMRDELEHVLGRRVAAAYGAEPEAVLAAWDAHVGYPLQNEPVTGHRLRCRDADDQVFLDLALQMRARWLFTSDRDLLSLRRRAHALGLTIMPPREWHGLGLGTSAAADT